MARGGIHRLTAVDLRRKAPGLYADGGGLYLQVTAGKTGHINRSWCFGYRQADARGKWDWVRRTP